MQTCSVAPASGFASGKSLPSSPWSFRKLPFASWPAEILVSDILMMSIAVIIGYSTHVLRFVKPV